jgi:hypothetical protein
MRAAAGQPLVMAARRGCPARFAEQGSLAIAVENDGEAHRGLGLGDGRDTAGPLATGAPSRYSHEFAPAGREQAHVPCCDRRDRRGIARCESKQSRSRSFILWKRALKDYWLIDDAAAPEVADRHDQLRAAVVVWKLKLASIGPSATMSSFRMSPEPAPIKPGDLVEWARQVVLPLRKSVASLLAGHTKSRS